MTQFESEPTEAGQQTLVPGVEPVTLGQRLTLRAEAPMQPRREQRPLDIGFWNPMRNQIELF